MMNLLLRPVNNMEMMGAILTLQVKTHIQLQPSKLRKRSNTTMITMTTSAWTTFCPKRIPSQCNQPPNNNKYNTPPQSKTEEPPLHPTSNNKCLLLNSNTLSPPSKISKSTQLSSNPSPVPSSTASPTPLGLSLSLKSQSILINSPLSLNIMSSSLKMLRIICRWMFRQIWQLRIWWKALTSWTLQWMRWVLISRSWQWMREEQGYLLLLIRTSRICS